MNKSKALANDIVNNLDKYTVNREEKMARSVDQLVHQLHQRIIKKNAKVENSEFDIAKSMGYGNNNTRTGD